ncbi:Gag-Pol polyprotein [Vitis vinifera]|uniref:Gag-Pol polyprotein n=1 Tax=Vitis vinifera TaxID=29760 RepID=A0A438FIR3_VITVI|nr:Gag-Pol polyprotein [Vitis vinifera]
MGIDIIGKFSPNSSSGHEYILVAIDYFTKWVEAASYARLTAARVAKFIRSHIIYRYGVSHELISDRGVHFRGEVDTLIQEYGIQHHKSSAYRPQTNGVVEAATKNIKRILRRWLRLLGIGQRSSPSHYGLIVHLFVLLSGLPHILWCMVWRQCCLLRLRWDP